jgi:hypothetical protein
MGWHRKHSEVDDDASDSAAWRVSKAFVWAMCNGAGVTNVPATADEVMRRLAPLPVPMTEPEIIAQVWDVIGDVVADRGR